MSIQVHILWAGGWIFHFSGATVAHSNYILKDKILQRSIEKILVDIIKHELNLPDNYGTTSKDDVIPSVIIYGQNIKLFNTDKMQITVRTVSQRVWSNRNEFKEVTTSNVTNYAEIQDINESRFMQIDVYSRNNDARERFWEVSMALRSVYAEQQMDLYNFKIGTITNSQNTSGIDGGSDINRFTISFNVLTHQQKAKTVDYYDKFETTFNNEQGQFADVNIPD